MGSGAQNIYELYRQSSVGTALADTLEDLFIKNRIDPQLVMKVLANFDRAIPRALQGKVRSRLTFNGNLDTYRFCDEVWTFQLKNLTFKMENGGQVVSADKIKIVSCTVKP
ncbi:transcription initiation factor IIA [Xylariaceae sp. FL1651]|nr:transcription initiation factor IIA [Xylariaceae sp. FL1651]